MLRDCVVDTNVLVQAYNPGDTRFHPDASAFLVAFLECETSLCVDPGVEVPPANTKSKIWAEYRDQGVMRPGSAGRLAIEALLAAGRISEMDAASIDSRELMRCVTDRKDHVFLKVAANTAEHLLVTNDGGYWRLCSARDLRKRYGVHVLDPSDARGRL